jgi:glycosyltransferase involved in cell wall biosynthesis
MKFVLILMVRNESRILERCLKSVQGFVDAFCIHDTGSTDTTRDIAQSFLEDGKRKGCLTESVWENFGANRTASFRAAQDYLTAAGWDLKTTYGLLLDADMIFHPKNLKEEALGEVGYSIVQCAGTLEYPNCRLVRMDYPWKCLGVTHEYWDGPTSKLDKETCWIEDQNDGGCKSDKFERDMRLLERGLLETPTNERYMFYLAQTYHSLGRFKDCIAMYKKRIAAGGWYEEIWYSHYMIGQSYLSLDDPVRFELWMQRAYQANSKRAEPLYKLTKYFREKAHHYKAYYYMQLGKAIPLSTESLFVESDVYTQLFHYEQSILEYYVHPETSAGLRASIEYMRRGTAYQQSVLSNLEFYAKPLGTIERLRLPSPFGQDYRASAVSLRTYPYANVRYVNYWIENGDYKTPPGTCVHTENAYVNLESGDVLAMMKDSSVPLPRHEVHVKGLEDIRLYGTDRFTATVQEYSEGVRVLDGRYNATAGVYEDCRILDSPDNRICEKNWLPVADTGNVLYDWYPLRVLGPDACLHSTPQLFSLFRGSAPPIRNGSEWWVLVHFVHYCKPRKYYHCVVALDAAFKPCRFSLPFVFRSASIEYCVSMRLLPSALECYASFQDTDASRVTIPLTELEWVSI